MMVRFTVVYCAIAWKRDCRVLLWWIADVTSFYCGGLLMLRPFILWWIADVTSFYFVVYCEVEPCHGKRIYQAAAIWISLPAICVLRSCKCISQK